MLPLLLIASIPAPSLPSPVETLDLSRMTFRRAKALQGQTVRVVGTVSSFPHNLSDGLLLDVECLPGVSVSVRLPNCDSDDWPEIGQRLTIEGVMRTRVIPGRLIDGEQFAAVQSVEVVGARLIEP